MNKNNGAINSAPAIANSATAVERDEVAPEPVRVMLATADPHLRLAVSHELAADRRTDLIAQPGGVAEAWQRMSEVVFDVLLADVRLDHLLKLISLRSQLHYKAEVVVICPPENEAAAERAFNAGAAGCIARNAGLGRFVQVVVAVANGGIVPPKSLTLRPQRPEQLLGPVRPVCGPGAATSQPNSRLSKRESEVLSMVAGGLRTREIAQALAISGETVNAHIKSIYHKLHVRSRAQAVGIAMESGLL